MLYDIFCTNFQYFLIRQKVLLHKRHIHGGPSKHKKPQTSSNVQIDNFRESFKIVLWQKINHVRKKICWYTTILLWCSGVHVTRYDLFAHNKPHFSHCKYSGALFIYFRSYWFYNDVYFIFVSDHFFGWQFISILKIAFTAYIREAFCLQNVFLKFGKNYYKNGKMRRK